MFAKDQVTIFSSINGYEKWNESKVLFYHSIYPAMRFHALLGYLQNVYYSCLWCIVKVEMGQKVDVKQHTACAWVR